MNTPSVDYIDFYFDFISPYSYLAATQIAAFEQCHAVTFHWLPINLPRLIKLSGNISPIAVKNKAIYSLRDLKRWAAYLQLPFQMILPGSFDSRPALRIASALQGTQRAAFCLSVFEAIWSGKVDMKNPRWLENIMQDKALPTQWLDMKNEDFEQNTHNALKAGAFGAPTFVLHPTSGCNALFFGMDHMDFLSRACDQAKNKPYH